MVTVTTIMGGDTDALGNLDFSVSMSGSEREIFIPLL